jgi:hypothetical protein
LARWPPTAHFRLSEGAGALLVEEAHGSAVPLARKRLPRLHVAARSSRCASTSGRAYVARDLQNQLAELHKACGGERTAFEYGER